MAEAIAYASYVTFPRSTRAEGTAAILQRSAHGGFPPLMIPGALERRVGRPTARLSNATAKLPHVSAAVDDRTRLEHEREGGGAPSERNGMRHGTIRARLGSLIGVLTGTITEAPRGQTDEQTFERAQREVVLRKQGRT